MTALWGALAALPAIASDTATAGVVAGLGLTAASGKSSVADGGGVAEGQILNTQAIMTAAAEIRRLVAKVEAQPPAGHAGGTARRVLVIGSRDTIDLSTARFVDWRLGKMERVAQMACADRPRSRPIVRHSVASMGPWSGGASFAAFSPADAVAAVATDVNVQGVTLNTDDRLLVTAILTARGSGSAWSHADAPEARSAAITEDTTARFVSPADLSDIDVATYAPGSVLGRFDRVAAWARENRNCRSLKDEVGVVDAFVRDVTATDKGPVPAIIGAAELDSIGDADVLKVAVEYAGGTIVTRGNIWYTLGFKGALSESAAFVASFRLVDPRTATARLTGVIRCMSYPISPLDVRKRVMGGGGSLPVGCNVIASPVSAGRG